MKGSKEKGILALEQKEKTQRKILPFKFWWTITRIKSESERIRNMVQMGIVRGLQVWIWKSTRQQEYIWIS